MIDRIEEWRPVVGWEGKYEVSSAGRVRSVDRFVEYRDGRMRFYQGCELTQTTPHHWGHRYVKLTLHRKTHNRTVHGLVLAAFVGPRPSPEMDIRHLNGDPTDNRVENLRYGTKVENAQDSIRHGRNKEINKTKCKSGHEFDGFDGRQRTCSACVRRRRATAEHRVKKSRWTRLQLEREAAADGRELRKRRATALWPGEEVA